MEAVVAFRERTPDLLPLVEINMAGIWNEEESPAEPEDFFERCCIASRGRGLRIGSLVWDPLHSGYYGYRGLYLIFASELFSAGVR